MSGRRLRNLLLLAIAVGVGWWFYRDQPTLSGFVDSITAPLLGSHAAVKESERKRVLSDATNVISQQTDENVGMLRTGMSMSDVRELLGNPDKSVTLSEKEPVRVRWTYLVVKRDVLFEDGHVSSIALR